MDNPRRGIGIGSFFGLVYVVVNATELGLTTSRLLQVLGMIVFVATLYFLRYVPSHAYGRGRGTGGNFAAIVLAEVIAIIFGIIILTQAAERPTAVLPWITLVVGLHFVALASLWREPSIRWMGLGITLLGVIGFFLAFNLESFAVISAVAGVAPGFILLGGGLWGAYELARE